jgi:hypothetical protein
MTDVTWNADDESPAASVAGQPRGDCPYLKNLNLVGAAPQGASTDLCYERNSFHVTSVMKQKQLTASLVRHVCQIY